MSDSLIDRFVTRVALEAAADPGTDRRGASYSGTAGYIDADAAHWAVERFIPIDPTTLGEYLGRRNELGREESLHFEQAVDYFKKIMQTEAVTKYGHFEQLYRHLDPDRDQLQPYGATVPITLGEPAARREEVENLVAFLREELNQAGYRQLEREEIEDCVGTASQWSVPLHVDFELFDQLAVYARGDVMGNRVIRRLANLYRPEVIEVPIYQRLVVLFQLCQDNEAGESLRATELHLRLFKNIPKQDVDMLLPGSQVKISNVDRLKIFVPSVGGLLWSLRKIVHFVLILAALTVYSTVVLGGLILAAIGYVVRSVLSYSQTKNRYLLNLTRNLYFQKLDANAGVGFLVVQQAREQTICELMLAYYGLLLAEGPVTRRRVKRRCERLVRQAIDVEIDFAVDESLQLLRQFGLARVESTDEKWQSLRPVAH